MKRRRLRDVTREEAELWRNVVRDVASPGDSPKRSSVREASLRERAVFDAAMKGNDPTVDRSVPDRSVSGRSVLSRLGAKLSSSSAPHEAARSVKTESPAASAKRPAAFPPSYRPPQSGPHAHETGARKTGAHKIGTSKAGTSKTDPGLNDAGLEPRVRRRLNRGRVGPDARLDLHGMTQADAHQALQGFILTSRARGHRLVLVITGKGDPVGTPARLAANEGRGVIKRALPRWLALPDMAPHVSGAEPAGPRHGGDGAFYVRLRK